MWCSEITCPVVRKVGLEQNQNIDWCCIFRWVKHQVKVSAINHSYSVTQETFNPWSPQSNDIRCSIYRRSLTECHIDVNCRGQSMDPCGTPLVMQLVRLQVILCFTQEGELKHRSSSTT